MRFVKLRTEEDSDTVACAHEDSGLAASAAHPEVFHRSWLQGTLLHGSICDLSALSLTKVSLLPAAEQHPIRSKRAASL